MGKDEVILKLENITKSFLDGKIIANDNISLDILKNEVHALVGENGSGKSTLMNIIFGMYKQDNGEIFINNENVDFYKTGVARQYKIGMVHQHFHLIEKFTVLKNVIIGQENPTSKEDEIKIQKLTEDKKMLEIDINNLKNEIKNKSDDSSSKILLISKNIKLHNKNTLKLSLIDNDIFLFKKDSKNASLNERKKLESKIQKLENKKEKLSNQNEDIDQFKKDIFSSNEELKKYWEKYELYTKYTKELKSMFLVNRFGILNWEGIENRFYEISKKYNINLDPNLFVRRLSVGQRQMLEILKVLWEDKDIIILDEPTATLSVDEIKELMNTIKKLKNDGKTIIFISHKLPEVKEIADRISVLRKGKLISTIENDSKIDINRIAKEMVGKIVELKYPKREINGDSILEVKNLTYITKKGFKAVDNVSFDVKEGEIFGLAGIQGNGQEQVVEMITNLKQPKNGDVIFKGKRIVSSNSKKSIDVKERNMIVSNIPIDRIKYAISPQMDLLFNSLITSFDRPEFSNKWKILLQNDFEKSQLINLKIEKSLIKEKRKNSNLDKEKVNFEKERKLTLLEIESRINILKEEIITLEDVTYSHFKNDFALEEVRSKIITLEKDIDKLFEDYSKVKNILFKDLENEFKIHSNEELEALENEHKTKFDKFVSSHLGINKRINKSKVIEWTNNIIDSFNVDGAFSNKVQIKNLSGGNQQKFVVGREVLRKHDVLVAGHPTRGLDISAIYNIYEKIIDNSKDKATILYSLEISELMSICDRMAIMYKGKIVKIVDPKKIGMDEVSKLMIGKAV